MRLSSESRFVDKDIQKAFYNLKDGDAQERELFKTINYALDAIEENAFSGIQIPKKIIPKYYIQKYQIKNLWKYNLPKGWRLFYSIINDEIVVVCLILEWLNHTDYEKRFNY
ncbi:MAG: type II toxin-antitoxin system RelE/ParE family toxin [Candidatus Woesearchaeota archaeon]